MARHAGVALVVVTCLACAPARVWAQAASAIAGVVKDTTGAVLPGVTVEASSPALIERTRSVVSDPQGQYKIVDLRPGTYTVTFSIAGFSTVKREGIELSAAFTATVNAELRVGALEETITVAGQSPMVDTQNVVQQKVIRRDFLESLPNSRSNYAALTPGASRSNDVGGSSGNDAGATFTIHGGRTSAIAPRPARGATATRSPISGSRRPRRSSAVWRNSAPRWSSEVMDTRSRRSGEMNRREAIGLLGAGAGLGLLSSSLASAGNAAMWQAAASPARNVTFAKGAIVRTILKDLSPDALASGVTLFHEHLSIELPPAQPTQQRPANAPAPQTPATADVNLIIEEVKVAAKDGITCIVDGGHADMGRRLEYLKQIANATGVHIVASGGYYMERTYPPELQTRSEDQIADDLAREAGANRYGAFGEIGENPNAAMSELERKAFRAVGKAHVRSNIPIFTHNAYGTGPNVPKDAGLRQLDVLESAGVKPQHVAIGHTCCLDDPEAEIIKQIAKRGAWVGFDRVTTLERIVPDDKRVKMVLALLDAGYTEQLLLSSDFTGARTLEGPLYGRTKTVFGAKLRAAGVKDETLHAILFDNPRRFLAFVPKKSR